MQPVATFYRCSRVLALALGALLLVSVGATAQTDPLPSWNDGPAKQAIVDFVRATTEKASPKFISPEARIATFDQDGTLWVEQPIYTQVMFAMERVPAVAEKRPELQDAEPFKAIMARDREAMAKFTIQDIEKIVAVTHSGMTVEAFQAIVKDWLATKDGKPMLVKLPEVLLIDDKTGKPEGINLLIGRGPVAAFGNSTGDQQMLEYTQARDGARLTMLVHHDDAQREYAYGPGSKVGTFSDALMGEAKQRGWVVISMKNDWKRLFVFEP